MSLRARILLLVLAVALLPLGLVGWWLSGTAARSGAALLSERLQETLSAAAGDLARNWTAQRSLLLDVADSSGFSRGRSELDSAALRRAAARLPATIQSFDVQDSSGTVLWASAPHPNDNGYVADLISTAIPLYDIGSGRLVGSLEAKVHATSLLGDDYTPRFGAPGILVGAVDPASGNSLLPLPFDVSETEQTFVLADERWLVERRQLGEPRIDLLAAAPLTPFVQPFETAARRGFWLLVATTIAAIGATLWLTNRMTKSLSRLARAADAIARGELEERVEDHRNDEVGRVARAFDSMADSLRRTIAELSRREALAAVGAFASDLAHEVRNPLTAIRVELEVAQEHGGGDAVSREALDAALAQVERLEQTVSGVLQLARSGGVRRAPLDLREPVRAAAHSALPSFEAAGARLRVSLPDRDIPFLGDSTALQQLFLNLLLNAAQALSHGGEAVIEASALDSQRAHVTITDNGRGVSAEMLGRIREPFFSTRAGGTGLGLGIAERIARAHDGSLEIESAEGVGTTVRVVFHRGGGLT